MKKLILTLSAFSLVTASFATHRYVKTSPSGNGSGNSWANAASLQDAIQWSASDDTIWVAFGTYKATAANNTIINISGKQLAFYGGFNGTETSLPQADATANPTILDGDYSGNDNTNMELTEGTRSDNSYKLVSYTANTMTQGVLHMQGFIFRNANNTGSGMDGVGGAVHLYTDNAATPPLQHATVGSLVNCTFEHNIAAAGGAVGTANLVASTQSTISINRCTFTQNFGRGSYGGGAISCLSYNIYQAAPAVLLITNSLLRENGTNQSGGAISVGTSSTGGQAHGYIGNNTFYNNTSVNAPATIDCTNFADSTFVSGYGWIVGGASLKFKNNIIRRNASIVPFEIRSRNFGDGTFTSEISYNIIDMTNAVYDGTVSNNQNVDPLFVDAANNNFRLTACSPAINAGDTAGLFMMGYGSMSNDLANKNRFNNTAIDFGAYEYNMDLNVSVSGYTSTAASVPGYTYQWYDCNSMQLISGATAVSYTAPLPGNYACIITDNSCLTDTTACMGVALSVNGTGKAGITIYPNPVNDIVNIDFGIYTNAQIILTGIDGKILSTVQASGTKAGISTTTLPSGIIILHITDDSGARVTRKLIKQ